MGMILITTSSGDGEIFLPVESPQDIDEYVVETPQEVRHA